MRRHWIAGAIATGTAGLALTGAAFGSGASGTEHLIFMTTATSGDRFNVIATGVFTAGGTATLPSGKGTLRFPTGTIETTSKSSKPINTSNLKTCLRNLVAERDLHDRRWHGRVQGDLGLGKVHRELARGHSDRQRQVPRPQAGRGAGDRHRQRATDARITRSRRARDDRHPLAEVRPPPPAVERKRSRGADQRSGLDCWSAARGGPTRRSLVRLRMEPVDRLPVPAVAGDRLTFRG